MGNQSRSRYLFKNTLIFTLGNLGTKFIAFFLIPLYTNVLSTSEYGIVDLVVTVATVAIPILTLNVMEAVMRYNLDKDADHDRITKVGITVFVFTVIVGLLIIPICRLFPPLIGLSQYVYLYCVCSAASQIFLCDLRGKELLIQYSLGNVINTLLIAIFNIVFLLVFHLGIKGYLCAYIISNSVIAVYALVVGKGYKAIFVPLDKMKMSEMLKFSIVLIPNSFMWWIMNSSDHVMVTSMIGVAANGIYAVSYKLPTLISTITTIFNQAWSYSAIKEEDAEDSAKYTNTVFFSVRGLVFMIGICMLAVMKPFMKLYVAADYFDSWKYTPFLVVGCVYLTMASFMSTSYTVHKDSKGFLVSGMFGAVLNVLLNFVLIPIIGVFGAATATCISYIAVFIFRTFHTRKYMVYSFADKEFVFGTVGLIINSVLMFFDGILFQSLQFFIVLVSAFLLRKMWIPYVNLFLQKVKRC